MTATLVLPQQLDFVITAELKPNAAFITRPAPGLNGNVGGGIEVVTSAYSFRITGFYMIGDK